eukprot:175348_1
MYTVNCRFHGSAKGCKNGVNCRFSHANPDSVVFCQNMARYNSCRFGNACLFRHTNHLSSYQYSMRNNSSINTVPLLPIRRRTRPVGKMKLPVAVKHLLDQKGKICNKVVYTEAFSRAGCPWFVIRTKNFTIEEKALFEILNALSLIRALKCFKSFRTKNLNGLAFVATHPPDKETTTNFTENNLCLLGRLKNIQIGSNNFISSGEDIKFNNIGDLGDNLIEKAIELSEYFQCNQLNEVNLYDTLDTVIRIDGTKRPKFQLEAWEQNKDKFMGQKASSLLDMNTIDFVKIFYPNIDINDGVTYTQWRFGNDSVCDVALYRLRYGILDDKKIKENDSLYGDSKNNIVMLLNEHLSSNLSNLIYEYSLYVDIFPLIWNEVQKFGWIELVKKCKMLLEYKSNTEIKIENSMKDKHSNDINVYIKGWNEQDICDAINYILSLYILPFNWCNCGPGCADYTWVQDWESSIWCV